MSTLNRTLLVMAGGTGGHVFPRSGGGRPAEKRDWRVVWMGAPDGMEAKLVPSRGYEMAWVRFAALRGKGLLRKLLLPFHLFAACWQARREIRRVRPDVVLGMGGYVSFPGGMMAALLGCPLIIHEQNSIAGLANRVLASACQAGRLWFPQCLAEAASGLAIRCARR
jgi:UDP-N-acetylglucosamine--N-acetylmuramyl-(pentapeptide) pyrophosphoryl-undecaprenol N-acetylglucosamine transferase